MKVTPDRYLTYRYAGASGDYNARLFGWNTYPGLALTNADGNYLAPPAGACGQFGNNFALRHSQTVSTTGHTVNTGDVTDHGYYCTQPALFSNWVLTPGSDNKDAYIAGDYDFGGGLQFYVFKTTSKNQRGELVCEGRWTNIVR